MSKFIQLFEPAEATKDLTRREALPAGSKKIPVSEFDRLAASALADIKRFKDTVACCTREFGMDTPPTLRAISLQVLPFFAASSLAELDALLGLQRRLSKEFESIDACVRRWKENALRAEARGDVEGFRRLEEQVQRAESLLQRLGKTHTE